MTPDEIAAAAGVAQAAIAFATLIVTAVVTVLIYVGTRRIAQIEHDRGVRDAWNTLDSIALADDSILRVAEDLMPDPSGGARSIDDARRKWFAYMILNALSSTYNAARHGVTRSRPDALDTCTYHVGALVKHDDIYELTQEGYSAGFAAFCRDIREKQRDERSE